MSDLDSAGVIALRAAAALAPAAGASVSLVCSAYAVQAAEQWSADLIVIGTPKDGTIEVDRLVRHSSVSVLIARPGQEHGPVIACTDFSEHALPAIESAAALAAASASPFHVLHALEPSVLGLLDIEDRDAADERSWLRARRDAAEHRLAAVAHAVDPRAETAVVEGLVVTALVDAARARRARLMAVGTSGRTGSRRVLLGSVAEELVRATPCSTLFVRLDRRKN